MTLSPYTSDMSHAELQLAELGCWNILRRLAQSGQICDNGVCENSGAGIFVCHKAPYPIVPAEFSQTRQTIGCGVLRSEVTDD